MESLTVFALVLLVAAATPGPSLFALIARSLGAGFWHSVPMAIGMIIGEIILLLLAALGLVALAAQMGEIFVAIKCFGVAYLLFLGWKLWQARDVTPSLQDDRQVRKRGARPWRSATAGLAIALGNPKTILFYVALLPTFIDMTNLGAGDIGGLCLVCAVVVSFVYGGYMAAAARARALFSSAIARRRLNRGAGVVMVGAAGAIAAS